MRLISVFGRAFRIIPLNVDSGISSSNALTIYLPHDSFLILRMPLAHSSNFRRNEPFGKRLVKFPTEPREGEINAEPTTHFASNHRDFPSAPIGRHADERARVPGAPPILSVEPNHIDRIAVGQRFRSALQR